MNSDASSTCLLACTCTCISCFIIAIGRVEIVSIDHVLSIARQRELRWHVTEVSTGDIGRLYSRMAVYNVMIFGEFFGLAWHVRSSLALSGHWLQSAAHDYTIPRILLQSNSNLSARIINWVLLGWQIPPFYGRGSAHSEHSFIKKIPSCTCEPNQEGTCRLFSNDNFRFAPVWYMCSFHPSLN